MYKTVCVVVLLLATFTFTSGSKPADASSNVIASSPMFVATKKLVNQASAIPTATIFTPRHTGLYRISIYMTLSKTDAASNSAWGFTLNWTDDGGAESATNLVNLPGAQAPPQAYGFQQDGAMFGPVLTLEAMDGIPVTYEVTQSGGTDNSSYSLYYTVELLE